LPKIWEEEQASEASFEDIEVMVSQVELEDKLGFTIVADDQKINCEAMRLNLSDVGIAKKILFCHDG
jgi:hypothetical protein